MLEKLSEFSKLKVLNLSNNKISILPEEISRLHRIYELNLYNNPIIVDDQFIDAINSMSNLKSIFIDIKNDSIYN